MAQAGAVTALCLLLFVGACGKSAQIPLHVWLPDAMEGPTPVSALIHAATMVTAGVYLLARFTILFVHAPTAQVIVACIGGITALLAALIALTQNDLKRVLAYSTLSQLGYMFLALGCAVGVAGGGTKAMATFAESEARAQVARSRLTLAQIREGREPVPIPYTTAIGSLARHCSERPPSEKFEPMNVTFGLIEDTSHSPVRDKQVRRQQMVDRALGAISEWKEQISTANLAVSS